MAIVAPFAPAVTFRVDDASQVGEARRAALAVADSLGFPETRRAAVAVVVTELAGNLAKHARDGQLVLAPRAGDAAALEILAVDRGPGMADPDACLADGYSTAGTPGTGLGAARRMADAFDLDSRPGVGTVIVARCHAKAARQARACVGGLGVPIAGERHCGDTWMAAEDEHRFVACVVDGLGHGELAERAALAAVEVLSRGHDLAPAVLLRRMHDALRATRGAAVLVVAVDRERRSARSAGVGNVAGTIIAGGETRSIVSHAGIVGHQMARVQEFEHEWPPGAVLVLASDGLRTQWRADAYPGLARRDPSLLAAALWRDHTRGRDDATVLVVREADA